MKNSACIVCGKELKSAMSEETAAWAAENNLEEPPDGATVFTSRGNYGSTLWDPGPSSRDWLQVTICDKCLTQATAAGRVLLCQPEYVPAPVAYTVWTGPGEVPS